MTDIVEFLTARLDEDEAAAVRAARPEPWVKPQPPRPDWYVQFWADEQDRAAVIADPESSAYPVVTTLGYDGDDEADEDLAEGRVEHIARHDPARVLAEVAAKRAIIAEHKHVPATDPSTHNFGCEICAYDRGDCVQYGWGWCNTVRLLAAPYADHPDYNPAWRAE